MDSNHNLLDSLKERKTFVSICVVALFYATGAGALWFLLPVMAEEFTKDITVVGILLSIPYVISTIVAIPSGELSDRVGRKTVGIIGLLIVILIGVIVPLVSSLPQFILFAIVLGLSVQLINAPARAFVMDIAPQKMTSEYFGIFISSINLGLAIGPMMVGFLMRDSLSIGITTVSYMYILIGLIGLFIFSTLNDTIKEREPLSDGIKNMLRTDKVFRRGIRQYRELKNLGMLVLVLTILFTITDGVVWTLEPLYYQYLKLSSSMGSLILAMFILPLIVLGLPAGRLADKYGKLKALVFGVVLSGISLILFGFSHTTLTLLLSAFFTSAGLAFAWASVSGLITDISVNKDRGCITGVWNMFMDIGYVIGPFLGGMIAGYFHNIGNAFSTMGLILLFSIILIISGSRRYEQYLHGLPECN